MGLVEAEEACGLLVTGGDSAAESRDLPSGRANGNGAIGAFAALEYAQISRLQLAGLLGTRNERLLGLTWIGSEAAEWPGDVPVQNLVAPLLGDGGQALGEMWQSTAASYAGEAFGIHFRADRNVLYGVVDVEENAFAATGTAAPLQLATEDAYRRIFRLLDGQGYGHLWRVWNYLADINAPSHGLERYRQFNVGRLEAFVASGRLAAGNVPAACALGVRGGPLTIAFLAGRQAAVPIENPRQVSAYHYPAEYGPRSPVFSRAALGHLPGQELLFVSGTASIVGHRTVHPGDVAGQTRETLANIEALLKEAGQVSRTPPYDLGELSCRAYIRHAADYPVVRSMIEAKIGPEASVAYIQADICRADLLVEIEAMASHPMGNC